MRILITAFLVATAAPVMAAPSAATSTDVRENLPGAPQKTREFADDNTRLAAGALVLVIAASVIWRKFKTKSDDNG